MKIGDYELDQVQQEIIQDDTPFLLVTAGAGSGKTLTILGKVYYLLTNKNLNAEEILCLSFTNAAAMGLKEKMQIYLNQLIPTYTFHKLSLELLKDQKKTYEIASPTLLEDLVELFFETEIEKSFYHLNMLYQYLKISKIRRKNYEEIKKEYKKELFQIKKLCVTFIRLMKCNNYQLRDFTSFLSTIKKTFNYFTYKNEKIILTFILNIYLRYQSYLEENNEIDFDDMLLLAITRVKNCELKKSWKYIIIDEYQDTSYIRFLLINEIIKKTNSKLMVVGDDYQSIYRFTGCDVSLFLNFSSYFHNAKIMKLEKTYRNSKQLVEIALKFILKNPNQMKKDLYSEKSLKNPIQIIIYQNIRVEFLKIIKELSKKKDQKILILGRNNFDIDLLLNDEIKKNDCDQIKIKNYEDLDITYMTVHKSKGLESDNVIIINLIDHITGFPNQIKNEKITRLVSKTKDIYPYSEERRLFYVAITRTKNYVYLLVPKKNPSIFIEELKKLF